MENDHKSIDISKLLSILKNEEDLIIKPYNSGIYLLNYILYEIFFLLYKDQHMRLNL